VDGLVTVIFGMCEILRGLSREIDGRAYFMEGGRR
jgi:hypothetical protein